MPVIVSLLFVALMIAALVDIITRDESRVRFVPKMLWIVIVILLPLIGSILWFVLGRDYEGVIEVRPRTPRAARTAPAAAPARVSDADARSTEQQLADLDREIEEWRLREELERRRRERGESAPE